MSEEGTFLINLNYKAKTQKKSHEKHAQMEKDLL